MLQGGTVGMVMHSASIPRFHEAEQYARKGLVPGGTQRNKNFRAHQIEYAPTLPAETSDILFDPQTSGGLLIAVAEAKAARLLEKLKEAGIKEAAIIGDVVSGNKGKIVVN
jgi:selenide,water dikinase